MHKLFYTTAILLLINGAVATEFSEGTSDAPDSISKRLTNTPTDELESPKEPTVTETTAAALPAKPIDSHSKKPAQHQVIQLLEGGRLKSRLTICPGNTLKGSAITTNSNIINKGSVYIEIKIAPGNYTPIVERYLFSRAYEGALPIIVQDTNQYTIEPELVPTEDGVSQLSLKLRICEPFSVSEPQKESSGNTEEYDDGD